MAKTSLVEMAMATSTAVPRSFSASGIIQGYHVYQRIWTPHVGEKVTMVREPGNEHDQFAVAVLKTETCTVGHLSREISRIAFLRHFPIMSYL